MPQQPSLQLLDLARYSREQLEQEQLALFAVLIERTQGFGFNPDVVTEYPDDIKQVLDAPSRYLQARIAAIEAEQQRAVREVRILTTYGNTLLAPLRAEGYRAVEIDMPAGPDHTYFFTRTIHPAGDLIYYFEAVNEEDEKIRPTFLIKLCDQDGALVGGISGAVSSVDGDKFAYISTVVARDGAPSGTGGQLATAALDYLKRSGVKRVNLGTQTADRFYLKQGFAITNMLVEKLRHRVGKGGTLIHHDLVIMAKELQ